MKRPPFDRRLPLFLVFAGIFAVIISLGSFNVSLQKMTVESPAPSGRSEVLASAAIEERKAAGLTWNLLLHRQVKRAILGSQESEKKERLARKR